MAKLKLFEITVEGAGEFPIDMLRYDACFPADEPDSNRIGWDCRRQISLRKVALAGKPFFNEARWASYGWKIIVDSHVVREY